MTTEDTLLERINLLRITMLHEWQRIGLDYANAEKPSIEASTLLAHKEVIAAVLKKDDELDRVYYEERKARGQGPQEGKV